MLRALLEVIVKQFLWLVSGFHLELPLRHTDHLPQSLHQDTRGPTKDGTVKLRSRRYFLYVANEQTDAVIASVAGSRGCWGGK